MRVLRCLFLWAALLPLPGAAQAESIVGSRVFADFAYPATTPEMDAAERAVPDLFAKAQKAGRPINAKVARSDSTTLISLESVAICERAKGCPLLVFRDITQKPVLISSSFQNLVLDYRDKGTYLIIRVWDQTTECRISGVTRAICHPMPPNR